MRSLLRVWLPLLAGLFAVYFIFTSEVGPRGWMRWAGLAVSLVGLAGVIMGRYTLGQSFSVKAKANVLVTTGIYSRIRNPIYISGMIFIVGLILIVWRPVLLLLAAALIPVQIMRARAEARVLEAKFGDEYRRYRERTWF